MLEESQRRGFLGTVPLENHLVNAERFASAIGDPPSRLMDLGSGGGLPGLVLIAQWPETDFLLLDASQRRCQFLKEAVAHLGRTDVKVIEGRAEEVARQPELRHHYPVVTARSFGPPAVTAECASGFLAEGGVLFTSEPPNPDSGDRWVAPGLAQLGMSFEASVDGIATIRQLESCGDRWPRRNGVPTKRPLF